jgi:hypothetical protein
MIHFVGKEEKIQGEDGINFQLLRSFLNALQRILIVKSNLNKTFVNALRGKRAL